MTIDGVLSVGDWHLRGANAEVVSTLRRSPTWTNIFSEEEWIRVAHSLDTQTPADERVTLAMEILRLVQARDPVACWLARFDRLPEHEFRQEFYPAYRDHSVHTLQVWLLGLYLFETVGALRGPLSSALSSRSASNWDSRTQFQRWWTLASIWHDTGYPFEADGKSGSEDARYRNLADALSSDGFKQGLAHIGIHPSTAQLAQVHRAGRHVPYVLDGPNNLLEWGDRNAVLDNLWRRLGFKGDEGIRAERCIDDLTIKNAELRPPFHDHGLFSALLLLNSRSVADDFLTNLLSSLDQPEFAHLSSLFPDRAKAELEESCLNFVEAQPLVEMAAEAVGYHNMDFRVVRSAALEAHFGPNMKPSASLEEEPHLVFLALVDTLQDWDRHRFRPSTPQNRPATTSSRILIQGQRDCVRVSLEGESNPRKRVTQLFEGWISGVDGLFQNGAGFSCPMDIQSAGEAPSLGSVEKSAKKLGELRSELTYATKNALAALTANNDDSILRAAEILDPVFDRIQEEESRLTQSHQEELRKALLDPELQNVERLAVIGVQPGRLLPVGRVESRIGGGGFGEVYRVVEETRGGSRLLALKVFHGFELDNETKRSYFERGFRAMKQLKYERGVVTVDAMLRMPFGMSMDYISGMNLEEAMQGRLDVHERLEILYHVAVALASAHNKGVIHRDVKPGNVLLDSQRPGDPVLTDFDLAHITGKTTVAHAHFASQLYGAPEQFNQRLEPFSRKPCVDVYGFGALMYFVLSRREPPLSGQFGKEQDAALQNSIGEQLPARAVGMLLSLVRESTAADPRSRLKSIDPMQQMEHIVRQLTACRRLCETPDTGEIGWGDWIQELAFQVTREADLDNPHNFVSLSEGLDWQVGRKDHCVEAVCSLRRQPRYEGVNFAGFARSSAKQVDRALEQFGKLENGRAPRATRHGQLGGRGSSMRIEIRDVHLNRSSAHEIADLLSAVARAVE